MVKKTSILLLIALGLCGLAFPVVGQSADDHYDRAKFYYGVGRFEEARSELLQLFKLNPDHKRGSRLFELVQDELKGRKPLAAPPPVSTPTPSKSLPISDKIEPSPEKFSGGTPLALEKHEILGNPGRKTRIPGLVSLEGNKYEGVSHFSLVMTGKGELKVLENRKPAWLILDIVGIYDALPPDRLNWKTGNVLRVRHSRFKSVPEPVTRVVFDLRMPASNYSIHQEGDKIFVAIPDNPTAPKASISTVVSTNKPVPPPPPPAPKPILEKLSGEGQEVVAGSSLEVPIILRVKNDRGEILSGKPVFFATQAPVSFDADPNVAGVQDYAMSDENGMVRIYGIQAPTSAGPLDIEARLGSKVKPDASTRLRIYVIPASPSNMTLLQSPGEETLVNSRLDTGIVVGVEDRYGNPVPGIPVQFKVTMGDFFLLNSADAPDLTTMKVNTDLKGQARVPVVRSGSQEGPGLIEISSPAVPALGAIRYPINNQPLLISMNFYQTPLLDIVRFLADYAGWNIIMSDAAMASSPEVTVHLEDMNVRSALDHILEMKGLTRVETEDGLVKIVTKTEAIQKALPLVKEHEEISAADNMVTRVFTLKFSNASELVQKFLPLVSEGGTIIDDSKSNSLIITDIASNIKRLEEILKVLDQYRATGLALELNIIHLDNIDAEKVVSVLNNLLGQLKDVDNSNARNSSRSGSRSRSRGTPSASESISEISDNTLSLQPELIRIEPLPQSNSILILAPATNFEQLKSLVKRMEEEIDQYAGLPSVPPRIVTVRNGKSQEFRSILEKIFPNSIVLSNQDANQVIVLAKTEKELEAVLEVLERLDVKEAANKYIDSYSLKYADPDNFLQILGTVFDVGILNTLKNIRLDVDKLDVKDIVALKKLEKDVIAVPIAEPPSLIIYANASFHSQIAALMEKLDSPEFNKIGQLEVRSFPVHKADIFTIEKMISGLLSESGKTFVVPEQKKITVIDVPSKLDDLENFIKRVDIPELGGRYRIYSTGSVKASEVQTVIQTAFPGALVNVAGDQVVVVAGQSDLEELDALVSDMRSGKDARVYSIKLQQASDVESFITTAFPDAKVATSGDQLVVVAAQEILSVIDRVIPEMNKGRTARVYPMKLQLASDVQSAISSAFPDAEVSSVGDQLLVVGNTGSVSEIEKLINELEKGKNVRVFQVNTNLVTDIQSAITTNFSEAKVSVVEDRMIVFASADQLQVIADIVGDIEKGRKVRFLNLKKLSVSNAALVLKASFPNLKFTQMAGNNTLSFVAEEDVFNKVREFTNRLEQGYGLDMFSVRDPASMNAMIIGLYPQAIIFTYEEKIAVLATPSQLDEIRLLIDKIEGTRVVRIFDLHHRQSSELITVVNNQFPSVTMIAAPGNRLVAAAGSQKVMDGVVELVKVMDSDQYRIVRLKNATASNVQSSLAGFFPDIEFTSLNEQNAVAFIASAVTYQKVSKVISDLDTNRVTVVRRLKFVQPEKISTVITNLISSGGGEVQEDKRTSSLVITASPDLIAKVDEVLSEIDRRVPQVLIEAVVASVELTDVDSLGIEWQYAPSLKFINKGLSFASGDHIRANLGNAPGAGAGALRFAVVNFADPANPFSNVGDLSAVIGMLSQYTSVNVIASPKVMVLDNEEANITLSQQIPFQTSTTNNGVTEVNVEFQNVDKTLVVTPHVGDDDIIELEVAPNITNIGSATATGAVTTSSQSAKTKVLVKNGYTLIIGGLIQGTENTNVEKVPVLGDIPLLGNLFQSKKTQKVNTETLIFITPHIVKTETYVEQMEEEKAKYPLLSDYVVDFDGAAVTGEREGKKVFLNLNTASVTELERVRGIDEALARLIVAYRTRYGFFKEVEEVMVVPGVTEDIYRLAKPYLYVTGGTGLSTSGKFSLDQSEPSPQTQTAASPPAQPGGESTGEEGTALDYVADEPSAPPRRQPRTDSRTPQTQPVEKTSETELTTQPAPTSPGVTTRINVNTADVEELSDLGSLTRFEAMLIIAYRDEYGDFSSVDDVYNVPGIERSTHPDLINYLTVSGQSIDLPAGSKKEEEGDGGVEKEPQSRVSPSSSPSTSPRGTVFSSARKTEPEREKSPDLVEPARTEGSTPVPKIDLNRATFIELMELPGLSEFWAKMIDSYRLEYGAFHDKKELLNIPGFTQSMYRQIEDMVYVGK